MTRIYARLPNESETYRKARQRLLEAEIALRQQTIAVAELRRELPLDTVVDDYVFDEGPADLGLDSPIEQVRLSQLCEPDRPLIVYHYMYGLAQTEPCPMCTMWLDGFNGIVQHVDQRANLAIVAAAPILQLREWARKRQWVNLRLLSGAQSSFKLDFQSQLPDGGQRPAISVFAKADDGTIRHFWTGEPTLDEKNWGGIDTVSPVWNLFDFTPQGRGEWMPQLEYAKGGSLA
jgi:predicted dithiol-disulfide oxidoreductase (DUF899 family)